MSTAARRAPEPPLALWLATSLFVHLAVAFLLLLGRGAWRTEVGDHGTAGGGDRVDEVEVTLLASEPTPDTQRPIGPEPRPLEQRDEDQRGEDQGEDQRGEDQPSEETRSAPAERERAPAAMDERPIERGPTSQPGSETSGGIASEIVDGAAEASIGGGGDAEGSAGATSSSSTGEARAAALILGSAGRLSGESVRASALLGENLACDDPIEGTWVAYRYSPEFRDWARFTLRVEREGTSLEGTIVARMWRGLPSERRPPPCSAEGWDYTVTMRATGNLIGDRMAFGASTHEVTRVDCASSFFSYNPDHFSGSVDPLADRMHTVNNDGGRDVNAPYEFHRTSCR